ncbi:MAG TPA: DUF2330 domain-containing protein [Acidimicrobiales bacterium]|nr:DUF2330 domain-containing protein [Acidimicrobiales bacterium]
MRTLLRIATGVAAATAAALLTAGPVAACGGLVAPNGTVRLLRTSTLAAYTGGIEHYVTSFQFAGGGAEFGSIVPLPGVPTSVERGGDWTLQRLQRETQPQREVFALDAAAGAPAMKAEVLLEKRIDALDLTVLRGGGAAVGDWAREHGFQLTPDAPEVLDFYAKRSPVFLAARFDADAARSRGQEVGDGTPIHLTIPTERPWVPIRILALGRGPAESVDADVYLLTDQRPNLLTGPGLDLVRSEPASVALLDDLRSDKGMGWVPASMHLTYLRVDGAAGELNHDLAIAPDGGRPSGFDFDRTNAPAAHTPDPATRSSHRWPLWPALALSCAAAVGVAIVLARQS